MTPVSQDKLDRIIEVLNEKGAIKPCPRCGNEEFTLVDAYINQPVQDDYSGINLGGPTIPCVIVICQKCGFISQHSLGYLGLLEKKIDE